jgi:hypothetical protein
MGEEREEMKRGTMRFITVQKVLTAKVTNNLGDEFTVKINCYAPYSANSTKNAAAIRKAKAAGMPESFYDSELGKCPYHVSWENAQ